MSTILKALKRIDQSTTPPEDLQSRPPRVDTKETLKARAVRTRLHRKLYLSLVLLVVVLAAGWFVYSQKDLLISKVRSGRTSDKIPIYQAKINPQPTPSPDPAAKRTTPPGRQSVGTGAKPEKQATVADMPSRPLPQMPAQQKKPILTSSNPTRPSGQPPTAKTQISQPQISDSPEAVQRQRLQSAAVSSGKTPATPPQVPGSYRRLDDAKLKLQAIAWSNEAAQRIAVINGHVVREGESVEGFSIDQIRQQDVIVHDGTETWQLEFKLK